MQMEMARQKQATKARRARRKTRKAKVMAKSPFGNDDKNKESKYSSSDDKNNNNNKPNANGDNKSKITYLSPSQSRARESKSDKSDCRQ